MSEYSHRGTCAVPLHLMNVAGRIWRALDPDVGGDSSFDILRGIDQAGAEWALTSALCTADFAAQAPYLTSNPQALLAVVAQDYVQRWEGIEPPSQADVVEFCASARIVVTSTDGAIEAHLVELGMDLVSESHIG